MQEFNQDLNIGNVDNCFYKYAYMCLFWTNVLQTANVWNF